MNSCLAAFASSGFPRLSQKKAVTLATAVISLVFISFITTDHSGYGYNLNLNSSFMDVINLQRLQELPSSGSHNDLGAVSVSESKEPPLDLESKPDKRSPGPAKISNFRKDFLLWDLASGVKLHDEPAQEAEGKDYFMYQCSGFCGGWADQIKGTVLAYMVANLTGRVFKARFLKPPCGMTNYMMPNRYNWSISDDFQPHKDDVFVHNRIGDGSLKFGMWSDNLTNQFMLRDPDNRKYHVLLANLEYLSGLKNTSVYKHELSWMKDLTPADIYASIYKHLFKLSPRMQDLLQNVLYEALPTPESRLVCIHVRLGHEAFGDDWARRNSMENLPKIWSFVETLMKSANNRLFVMSDSGAVLESARNQTFGDRILTIPGSIVHINKFIWKDMANVCNGLQRLLLEHHMLMNCDVLVRGHSGISVIASAIRGSDKDLYCLLDDGTIESCQRNNFTTFL